MSHSTRFPLFNLLLRDTRGSILPMLAFGLLMLVTAVGVAIDLSREQTTHAKLNAALDASTIAAAKSISGTFACGGLADADACIQHQVSNVGKIYFNANYANAFGGTTDATGAAITPEFSYDYTTGNVIGTVNANTPTTFMQIVGQSTFPVQANSLTQASIFYLGQGITTGSTTQYLNPIAYNDTSTGLYSSQSWATAVSGAQAYATDPISSYNKGTNSIALSANGFDTLEIVPNTANGVNDVVLGNNSWNGGAYTGNEFGPTLWFGGKTGQNSDPIYFQRQNFAANSSAIYLVIGDDYGGAFSGDSTQVGDAFILGSLDAGGGDVFKANFMVTSDGHTYLGDTSYTGDGATGATFPETGAELHFGSANLSKEPTPATADNTDDLMIERWNIAFNQSALVVNLAGGDYSAAFNSKGGGDAFIIGATDTTSNYTNFHALFTFTSDGKLGIGDTNTTGFTIAPPEPAEALDVYGAPVIEYPNSARLNLVDTDVVGTGGNTGVNNSPAWAIDNNEDVFRVFRQPNLTTGGNAYLLINSAGLVQMGSPASYLSSSFVAGLQINNSNASFNNSDYANIMLGNNGGTHNVLLTHETNGDFDVWNGYIYEQGGDYSLLLSVDPSGDIIAGSSLPDANGDRKTGYIVPGSNSGILGTPCIAANGLTPTVAGVPGAIKYDSSSTNHRIVYCDGTTDLWSSLTPKTPAVTVTCDCEYGSSGGDGEGSCQYSTDVSWEAYKGSGPQYACPFNITTSQYSFCGMSYAELNQANGDGKATVTQNADGTWTFYIAEYSNNSGNPTMNATMQCYN